MKKLRFFILFILAQCIILLLPVKAFEQSKMRESEQYVCMPCGNECDKIVSKKPGECPHCHMQMVKKSSVVFKTINPSEVCNYVANHKNVVLLDVRTKEEFEGKANPDFGTLKNATNIPVQELQNRSAELESYKDKEIIVYCSHSHRSPQASYLLTQNGFTNVKNMTGGMSTWDNSGKGDCLVKK